jgi:hypothetical protein
MGYGIRVKGVNGKGIKIEDQGIGKDTSLKEVECLRP